MCFFSVCDCMWLLSIEKLYIAEWTLFLFIFLNVIAFVLNV